MSRNVLSFFIHSTGTGPALWAGVPQLIGEKFAPANLGYPPHPLLPRGTPFTLDDEIAHLRRLLPPGPMHIFAHSYGGLVALKMARLLGAEVKSMFLYEPVLFGALSREADVEMPAYEEVKDFLANDWFLTDESRGGTEAWIELFVDYWNRRGAWKFMTESSRQYSLQLGWKMFQEVRAVFFDPMNFSDFAFDVPMTIVSGERTPAASRAMVRALHRVNPHARVVVLPKLGHMAPLTSPAPVHAQMLAHVQSLK